MLCLRKGPITLLNVHYETLAMNYVDNITVIVIRYIQLLISPRFSSEERGLGHIGDWSNPFRRLVIKRLDKVFAFSDS